MCQGRITTFSDFRLSVYHKKGMEGLMCMHTCTCNLHLGSYIKAVIKDSLVRKVLSRSNCMTLALTTQIDIYYRQSMSIDSRMPFVSNNLQIFPFMALKIEWAFYMFEFV